jgi:hypothetical protein
MNKIKYLNLIGTMSNYLINEPFAESSVIDFLGILIKYNIKKFKN